MNMEKDLVLMTQVRGKKVEMVAVYTFDCPKEKDGISKAASFCAMINGFKLEGEGEDKSWAFAQLIRDGVNYEGAALLPRNPFDDFMELSDWALQHVLREVDTNTLATALKGASEATREKFYKNLSEKFAFMLKEDIEFTGPLLESRVQEAQNTLLDIALRLQSMGIIDNFGTDERKFIE
jgi:hypothetical protein